MKKFASALYCLIGRAGYELLQTILGGALSKVCLIAQNISRKKVTEGKFYFDELKTHLEEWKAPSFVHIQLDDTRVKRKVGWCLPIKNGIPDCNAFVLALKTEKLSNRLIITQSESSLRVSGPQFCSYRSSRSP